MKPHFKRSKSHKADFSLYHRYFLVKKPWATSVFLRNPVMVDCIPASCQDAMWAPAVFKMWTRGVISLMKIGLWSVSRQAQFSIRDTDNSNQDRVQRSSWDQTLWRISHFWFFAVWPWASCLTSLCLSSSPFNTDNPRTCVRPVWSVMIRTNEQHRVPERRTREALVLTLPLASSNLDALD